MLNYGGGYKVNLICTQNLVMFSYFWKLQALVVAEIKSFIRTERLADRQTERQIKIQTDRHAHIDLVVDTG